MHEQFYGELLRYFVREVKDTHDAQDLVHETYGRVLAKVAAGDRIEDLRGLLYEIARNLLIDRHRQLLVRKHSSDEVLAGMHAPASLEPDACYAGQQRVRLLERAIESLPLRCRQAIVLHKLDGLPQAEVAARMGVSINMVERHIMLALASCRKALGDERPGCRPAAGGPAGSAAERTAK